MLTTCRVNGSCSYISVSRQYCICSNRTVPRFRAGGHIKPPRSGLPLITHKRTATLLIPTIKITVPVIFAVGETTSAVLLCAVKGGVRHQNSKISAVFKVLMSLFLSARFFIGHLTLSPFC